MIPISARAGTILLACFVASAGCGQSGIPEGGELADPAPASTADPVGAGAADCVVGRVVDGDSLECADGRRLRLLLIDSPELDQDPFGEEARRAMDRIAPVGTPVNLSYDIERRDDYDRELVYVSLLDGSSVNEEMLRRGFAVVIVFPPNVREVDRFRTVSDSARTARRGLWAVNGFECLPIAHRSGRCQD